MRKVVGTKTYDSAESTCLAAERTHSNQQELYQTSEGSFCLLIHQIYVDGKRLNPHELWVDLRSGKNTSSRLRCVQDIVPLTDREALEWCVKTQIPETLRGYLLDCI